MNLLYKTILSHSDVYVYCIFVYITCHYYIISSTIFIDYVQSTRFTYYYCDINTIRLS